MWLWYHVSDEQHGGKTQIPGLRILHFVSRKTNTSRDRTGENWPSGDQKKKPWCDHCKMFWHTQETYQKLHGKPLGWKKRPEKALQTGYENLQARVNSRHLPFTEDQIGQLLKLLQSSSNLNSTSNQSSTFAQNGKLPIISYNCSKPNNTWIINSGATNHMTNVDNHLSFFQTSTQRGN